MKRTEYSKIVIGRDEEMRKVGYVAVLIVGTVLTCALFTQLDIGVNVAYSDGQMTLGGWKSLGLQPRSIATLPRARAGGNSTLIVARPSLDEAAVSGSGSHSLSLTSTSSLARARQETPTLTRLGSYLSFDVNSCPSGSPMLENWRNQTPLHDNCPTLFIVGARKGGTTSLYHYMDKHPKFKGILLKNQPMDGETFYFSAQYNSFWNSYASQFPKGVMSGESSVDNIVSCQVPRRLFKSCGLQAKVVVLLRNPILRFVSNFLMRARLGAYGWHPTNMKTNISIEAMSELQIVMNKLKSTSQSCTANDSLSPGDWNKYKCRFRPAMNMVFEGMYYIFMMNYLCNFPAENILIINSEEFFRSPSKILSQVLYFLGLEQLDVQELDNITSVVFNKHENIVLPHQVLSAADKEQLNCIYRPFNAALFRLLGWDNNVWNQ